MDDMRRSNFERAYNEMDEEDKEEISEIISELEKIGTGHAESDRFIKNKELKKRVAGFCLRLVEDTPKNRTTIMETSYVITGAFVDYEFGDDLDKVIRIAEELEIPHEYSDGHVFKLFDKMKKILVRYLRVKSSL